MTDIELTRNIKQWEACLPEIMAMQSEAALRFAFADMKKDILTLHRTVQQLRARLEIDDTGYDGIAARDATIEAQQKVIEQLREERGLLNEETNYTCPDCGGKGFQASCEKCIPY